MARGVIYTKEEDNLLKEKYPIGIPIWELAEQLGRSQKGINRRAQFLGLKRKIRGGAKKTWRQWSPEQEENLRNLWPRAPKEKIMEAFPGFTWSAIWNRAQRLDLPSRFLFYDFSYQPPKLEIPEIAYIAGIVDGEGSISIIKSKRKNHFLLYPMIAVYNTSTPLMLYLDEKLHFDTFINRGRTWEGWRSGFMGRIQGFRVMPILELLYPYLIVKKRQAGLVLALGASRKKHPRKSYTKEEIAMYQEVKALNGRPLPQSGATPSMI